VCKRLRGYLEHRFADSGPLELEPQLLNLEFDTKCVSDRGGVDSEVVVAPTRQMRHEQSNSINLLNALRLVLSPLPFLGEERVIQLSEHWADKSFSSPNKLRPALKTQGDDEERDIQWPTIVVAGMMRSVQANASVDWRKEPVSGSKLTGVRLQVRQRQR